MRNKTLSCILSALLLVLTSCGGKPEQTPVEEPYTLTVCTGGSQDTLDPARSTAPGGETVLYHLYENLMRWEDGGDGWAVLAPGQAESYTADTDFAGNATYTFTLRESAAWSDGRAVMASDFVKAWQRLADPANDLPHRELMEAVSGYTEVQESGDVSRLSVSAPDDRTFVVTLDGSPAYFLSELCAGAYTMPVREDVDMDGTVTNGAYTAAECTSAQVRLERSGTYYNITEAGPSELCFVTAAGSEADYAQFTAGGLDLVTDLPDSVLEELAAAGTWTPEPVTTVYGVLLNTAVPPFDDLDVRTAFRLVTDTQAAAARLKNAAVQAASGLIPCGTADYSERPETEADDAPAGCWDFRTHSLEKVTMPAAGDYEDDCRQARRLLSQAGYPRGDGFPLVEYVYVASGQSEAIAEALRQMWQEELGIAVILRRVSQEEYDALLTPPVAAVEDGGETDGQQPEETTPAFQIAAWEYTPRYNDAEALLDFWRSENTDNPTGYTSSALDILLDAVHTAFIPDVRDALLHDAEAILTEDAPVIPVCYPGGSYQLADKWSGLYRAPDGVYFLFNITAAE